MEYTNDNVIGDVRMATPLQVLVTACIRVQQPEADYTWLQAYGLLTCRTGPNGAVLQGEIRIGERYAENADLITSLSHALQPAAILVGSDLTSLNGNIGRLPIDAQDPAPSLALLAKLRSMLEAHEPIDLGATADVKTMLEVERLTHDFGKRGIMARQVVMASPEQRFLSANPQMLAEQLADEVGACLRTMGHLMFDRIKQAQLDRALANWRRDLVPVLPPKEAPAETIV